MKTRNERLEALKLELSNLRNELFNSDKVRSEVLKEYKEKEVEIINLTEEIELIKYNKEHEQKREKAKIVFELEKVDLNDITNDGQINKLKLKKYPKCKELDYLFFCNVDFRRNDYKVNYSGKWTIFFNNSGKMDKITEFNSFLNINGIEQKEITLKQYQNIKKTVKNQLDKIKKLETELKETKDNLYQYYINGLLIQKSETIYSINTKF
jgi:hypothetical protein